MKRRFHSHAPSVAVYTRVQEEYLMRLRNKQVIDQEYSRRMLSKLQNADALARAAGAHAPCSDASSDELDTDGDVSSANDQGEVAEKTAGALVKQYVQTIRRTRPAASGTAESATAASIGTLPPPTVAATKSVELRASIVSGATAASTQLRGTSFLIPTTADINNEMNVTVDAGENDDNISSSCSSDDSSIPEGEFAVEKIVGKRLNEKQEVIYCVKWAGYPSSENTWEPLSNLTNAMRYVNRFEGKSCCI